jgi:hypothetical protein
VGIFLNTVTQGDFLNGTLKIELLRTTINKQNLMKLKSFYTKKKKKNHPEKAASYGLGNIFTNYTSKRVLISKHIKN